MMRRRAMSGSPQRWDARGRLPRRPMPLPRGGRRRWRAPHWYIFPSIAPTSTSSPPTSDEPIHTTPPDWKAVPAFEGRSAPRWPAQSVPVPCCAHCAAGTTQDHFVPFAASWPLGEGSGLGPYCHDSQNFLCAVSVQFISTNNGNEAVNISTHCTKKRFPNI